MGNSTTMERGVFTMPDPINTQDQSQRAPQVTALSTAYPMHFETTSVPSNEDPRRIQNQTTRAPHRHEAGE
jgi:hypothetical protein